jgi:thioredoxin 1
MGEKTFVVDTNNFEEKVLKSDVPVLVDFWAEWCQPCKMIAPIVDEIATENEGSLRVAKMDADANADVIEHYRILGIPTLLLFKNGEVVERITGLKKKSDIVSKLTKHF